MASPPSTPCANVLVVDDEPDLRTLYELTLLREGHLVTTAGSVRDALDALSQMTFDVVITDMRLPDGLGIEVLKPLREQKRPERCIVITAHGSAENAVESLKAGAFDYLTKPVDLKQFRSAVASAWNGNRPPQASELATTAQVSAKGRLTHSDPASPALDLLVGKSAPMLAVRERIAKVARSMAPVLIHGESGTGKELAARAIHASSHRAKGPWIAVNCGAIPESLLESEFFGVRKGAFTGASHDRDGFFQAAHGGTLFLDEIGDLPLSMQSKLLRAIQERKIRPIGSNFEESVDVRLVSATHKDLAAEVVAHTFRQDLYYRLNVIDIHLPPLRDRREDLDDLCTAILRRICDEAGVGVPMMSESMRQQLQFHPLKGNVRELENLLHRALALSDNLVLEMDTHAEDVAADLTPIQGITPPHTHARGPSFSEHPESGPPGMSWEPQAPTSIPSDLQGHLDAQERNILIQALKDSRFNRTAAAHRLGISLRQIRYRMERLRIVVPGDGEEDDKSN